MLKTKRIYEKPEKSDGTRILVDRLWPRGLRKEDARIDLWMKEIAPENELRKWYGHEPRRWREFKKKYFEELENKKGLAEKIARLNKGRHTVTLLFSAREERMNQAEALKQYIEKNF